MYYYYCSILASNGLYRKVVVDWKWITIKKLSELSGYTQDAIRAKMKKGVWLAGLHWKKAPDGRILFNKQEIEKWVETGLV